jgi:CHAT domain-containing protein
LNDALKDCRSVVHFACHGEVDRSGKQKIYLSEQMTLSSTQLNGLTAAAQGVAKARPLVFLNACKAGQPTPSLVGAGGLAAVFAAMGAGAVVAPLWSVKDSIAHEIAIEFYTQAKAKPAVPFAEILRTLRAKAYDETIAEDTYAAYCFYGDPLARSA